MSAGFFKFWAGLKTKLIFELWRHRVINEWFWHRKHHNYLFILFNSKFWLDFTITIFFCIFWNIFSKILLEREIKTTPEWKISTESLRRFFSWIMVLTCELWVALFRPGCSQKSEFSQTQFYFAKNNGNYDVLFKKYCLSDKSLRCLWL